MTILIVLSHVMSHDQHTQSLCLQKTDEWTQEKMNSKAVEPPNNRRKTHGPKTAKLPENAFAVLVLGGSITAGANGGGRLGTSSTK